MEEQEIIAAASREITFAKILSYLFHPLFMPTYGLLLLFFSNQLTGFNLYAVPEAMADNRMIFLIVILFTMILPGLSALILKRMGEIKSLEMNSNRERLLPFALTGGCYLLASVVLQNVVDHPNQLILIVLAGAQLAILLALVISVFWKISIHMIGIGGIVGTEILMMHLFHFSWDLMLYGTLLIAGLVGFARLRLNAHQPFEVLAGFILGVITETLLLFVY
ncbi:MAG: hypothetical protein NT150_15435 [Bacteroidetes bacterium]|nr:hypothetical protein [Bacteroidota bacterium]